MKKSLHQLKLKTFKHTALCSLLAILLVAGQTFAQNWRQKGADIDGQNLSDRLGFSTAINADGTVIAAGAPFNDDEADNAGQVQVFKWDGSNWNQLGADINGNAEEDWFGVAVSLSDDGNTLAVGAYNSDPNGSSSGSVRVLEWDGSAWNQRGTILNGEGEGDLFGFSVSLSADGSFVAVGAPNASLSRDDPGYAKAYRWSGSTWILRGTKILGAENGDRCGYSVSLSDDGETLGVGSFFNDDSGIGSGHVRVFDWDNGNWTQRGQSVSGASGDRFGCALSMSADGDTYAAGALASDAGGRVSGQAKVYRWDGTNWVQKGRSFNGTNPLDEFGESVSLSKDGNVIAIGSRKNGDGGIESGHVQIFAWTGTNWIKRGQTITGESIIDESGSSLGLSADGKTLAIGAPLNDGGAGNAGHVRVMEWPFTTSVGDEFEAKALSLFPNPTSGAVVVKWSTEAQVSSLSLYDVLGKQLASFPVNSTEKEVRLALSYPPGVYLINLETDTGILESVKVIKQ